MHIHFLDPFKAIDSPIHELDPRVKLVLSLAFILTTAIIPHGAWPVYIFLLAIIFSIVILSRLGFIFVLKRSALALPFVLAAFPVIFTIQGDPLASFNIGNWQLIISLQGVERLLSITLKSWISIQTAIVLASSTRFPDLLMAMRAIHIPRLLVAIFGLMWRYLFVMADEALRLLRARLARSGDTGLSDKKSGGSLAWRAHVTGGMAGSLFLRALERSDRIYNAMISRGYDGDVRTLPQPPLGSSQWAALIGGLGLLFILLVLSIIL
ncbi:MAG: cobalt ECF transporter T component CbiQ [Anaerolineales bacterium]|nr:cobalt ECF transporter T component CbiQ [Anaerolineales bacterium]